MTNGRIRRARPEDVDEILAMVRDLAEYERATEHVVATSAQIRDALFCEAPAVFAHVVEHDTGGGHELGGFAMWFLNFSTWLGRHGLYLEDLYVRPELRGSGYGKALLGALARECIDHEYGRLEWWVLDWNEPALGFYRSLGALPMDDWTVHRVTGANLHRLAMGENR